VERGRGRGGSSYRSRSGISYHQSRRATSDSSTDSSTDSIVLEATTMSHSI
jgi:hypothetical protein